MEEPAAGGSPSLGQKAVRGARWALPAAALNLAISFLGNLVLARVLSPEDFGVFALALSLLAFIFMLAGFGAQDAIVQCRDDSLQDLIPTAFWMALGLGALLALGGVALGLGVSHFYGPTIGQIICALSVGHLVQAAAGAYRAILERDLSYRQVAISTTVSVAVGVALGILAALAGLGVWSLAVRELASAALLLASLRWASGYRLPRRFDRRSARWVFGFGWRVMFSRVAEVVLGRFDQLVVGTFLGTVALGHYSLAVRLALLGHQLTQSAVQQVSFSVFASLQDARDSLRNALERVSFWVLRGSILLGLATLLLGRELVVIVYGEKWELAGRVFQGLALFLVATPAMGSLKTFLIASGHVDRVVRVRFAQVAIFVPGVALAAHAGALMAVVWALSASAIAAWVLMAVATARVVELDWPYLLRAPAVAALVTAAAATWLPLPLETAPLARLFLGGVGIALAYGTLLALLEWKALRREWRAVRTRA